MSLRLELNSDVAPAARQLTATYVSLLSTGIIGVHL